MSLTLAALDQGMLLVDVHPRVLEDPIQINTR
jgi:hypothetical protein